MKFSTTLLSAMLAFLLLACSHCWADTLFYLSASGAGEGAMPVAPQETLRFSPSGGSFHIWVQPDELLTGISLDVDTLGTAIRFTDATVHNPTVGGDSRWLPSLIRHGDVSDAKVSRIEGGALAPLTGFGTGIGPATTGSDLLYESGGGFLFATIDFDVPMPSATATVSLSVGHNLISDENGVATGSLLFGVADGPVTNSVGSTGAVVDLNLEALTLHPSDFDSDGDTDGADYLAWQDGFGITTGAMRTDGDADANGRVDGADLTIWQSQYATVPLAATVAVPEPSAALMMFVGMTLGLATLAGRR